MNFKGKNNPKYKDGRTLKAYFCTDCNKKIHSHTFLYGQKRCMKCKSIGQNNANYKGIRKKYYCIDCKKEVSRNDVLRCRKCDSIIKSQITRGANNPCWKGGLALRKNYCNCGKLLSPKAKRCIPCQNKINNQKKKGIKLSKLHREKLSIRTKGDRNPNWQGGISKLPYSFEFAEELKEFIRKRDNRICQNCGMSEEEHFKVFNQRLHIHHIDYNKQNAHKTNLISLCLQCNIRANYNRQYWHNFYLAKLTI